MKKVLYISYDGMTDPLGQSQVLPYMQGLSNKGFKYHLLSFEKADRFISSKSLIENICKDHGIEWIPMTYTKNPPVLSTILDVYKLYKIAKRLHREETFSIVHCRSYVSSLVGLKMKRKFGVKFLFDMRGFWADERVDGKLWNLKNPLYKSIYAYFKSKEKKFLHESDHIISLTHAGKKEIISWTGNELISEKISVIPCCADLTLFKPKDCNGQNKFVIGYLGSLGTWYMLDEMMLFFKNILKQIPEAQFHFLTKDDKEIVFKSAEKYSIEKKLIKVEEAQRAQIPDLTKCWRFSIFFIKPSYSKKSSSPTKQGELMGLGIPIICNKGVGDVDEIVTKYNSGIVIENIKTDAQIDFTKLNFNKKDLHEKAKNYFSLYKGIQNYNEIYLELLQ